MRSLNSGRGEAFWVTVEISPLPAHPLFFDNTILLFNFPCFSLVSAFSFKANYSLSEFEEFDESNEKEASDNESNVEKEGSETKSIFGVDVKTNKAVYGSSKPIKPTKVDNYRDPAVTETKIFGSYRTENPMAKAYSESTDTSTGYNTMRVIGKGRNKKSVGTGPIRRLFS